MLAYVIQLTALFTHLRLAQTHSATSPPRPPPLILSVTDYGATGDGVRYDTVPIQAAINSCPSSPSRPCHVTFPPGSYLTATVHLRSHVTLVVRKGATILGGTEVADYPAEPDRWYVILAEGATDIGITGGGVVDGQGLRFVERFDERKNVMVSWNKTGSCVGDECRPRLVGFLGCKNVKVWDVELRLPAYWW